MKKLDEKLNYIKQRIQSAKGFHVLGLNDQDLYRFKVEGEGTFEYAPSVVFLFSKEFVARADPKKLAKSLRKAISLASDVLKDPPSKKCNLQGWIKIMDKGVIFVPYIVPPPTPNNPPD
jgi:hypothetical protein